MDWATAAGISLTLAALAVAMVSLPRRPEFRVARLLFIAAALVLCGKDIWWGIATTLATLPRIVISGVIGAVLLIGLVEALRWVNRHEQAASVDTASRGVIPQTPVLTIFAECHQGLAPKLVPPEGRIYVHQLWPMRVENGGGGLAEMFAPAGTEWVWPKPASGALVFNQCQITNYSDVTLFNIAMALKLRFVEVSKDENSSRSGETKLEREWLFHISKIDPGAANPFTFYVVNFSPYFVEVSISQTASAQTVGDGKSQSVAITLGSQPTFFVPFEPEPTSPPASPHPTPAPQSPPEKK
jgi:hypothetical protein